MLFSTNICHSVAMYVSYHYNDMEKLKLLTTFYITLD
jgi:hypothetical protein